MSALPAEAATIFGRLTQNGAPVRRAQVELACGNERDWRPTDESGAYRLTVASGGRCKFTALGVSVDVVVFGEPAHYDWEFRPQPAPGQLIRR